VGGSQAHSPAQGLSLKWLGGPPGAKMRPEGGSDRRGSRGQRCSSLATDRLLPDTHNQAGTQGCGTPPPFSPLLAQRCSRVAPHKGGEAFPVVGARGRWHFHSERRSWFHHVAVLGFDHGPRPL
jgi:hypothetical protein